MFVYTSINKFKAKNQVSFGYAQDKKNLPGGQVFY